MKKIASKFSTLFYVALTLIVLSIILHYFLLKMEWKDILVIDALILGPILAAFITRLQDDKRFRMERKLTIFRALMKDRRNQLSNDFVGAFNLIQAEFYDDKEVINAWKALYESLNSPLPSKEDENGWSLKFNDWNNKTTKLLHEIAKVLEIPLDQLDIQNSYIPIAWGNNQQWTKQTQSLLLEVLENKRPLVIKVESSSENKQL